MKTTILYLAIIMMLLSNSKLYAQGGAGNNAPTAGNTNTLGWKSSGTAGDQEVPIENWLVDKNITLKTNDASSTGAPTTKMTIIGCNTCPTDVETGNVGIGTAGPTELLQVLGGNIDVKTSGNSYMINSKRVLGHGGNVTNIYVGVDAGAGGGGASNTFVGNAAGYTNSSTGGNTFIGESAGYLQTGGGENTFIGSHTGFRNIDGNVNCYLGAGAGYWNEHGTNNTLMVYYCGYNNLVDENSFFGAGSGYLTTSGPHNSFFGMESGYSNTEGAHNSFFGQNAGYANTTGDENTIIGAQADVGAVNLINATAIGSHAIVMNPNEMILGTNAVNVGIGLSGNSTGPRWKLEIDEGNADQSGLQFRQLTSGSATLASNPGSGVLAVDNDGKVVYVPGLGGAGAYNGTSLDVAGQVQLGQDATGGSGAELQNDDRDIPMNNLDIYFTDATSHLNVLKNNIAMGVIYPNASTSPARLTVEKASSSEGGLQDPIAGEFTSWVGEYNAIGRGVGVWGKALEIAGNTNNELMGGRFEGKGTTGSGTYGVWAQAAGDRNIWGGKFEAAGNPGTTVGIGVEGRAAKAAFNIGVYGFTQAPVPPLLNYAVYGDLGIVGPLPPPCIVLPCPPVTFPDAAGYFNGDMVSTTSFFSLSDGSFKANVENIQNAIGIINQLNPKSYTFSQELHPSMQMPTGSHYGLISQEVQNILPGVVKDCIHPARYDSVGNEIYAAINFKALNYTELIPFLIAGMKEQQQTIEAMQAQIANLTGSGNRHANPGGNGDDGNSNSIDIELKNIREIVLNQNFPNPFAEHTTITFVISDDVKKAQIFFYDDKGTILKSVDINEKGEGQINVYAPDLSSGIYKYTLITDGKPVETKQMVKSN